MLSLCGTEEEFAASRQTEENNNCVCESTIMEYVLFATNLPVFTDFFKGNKNAVGVKLRFNLCSVSVEFVSKPYLSYYGATVI